LGVWVCWAGPRWWKCPLSEPVPMVPSRLMERWPGSLGLLLPAPMCADLGGAEVTRRGGGVSGIQLDSLTGCCPVTHSPAPTTGHCCTVV
jgi:hypothetical protein